MIQDGSSVCRRSPGGTLSPATASARNSAERPGATGVTYVTSEMAQSPCGAGLGLGLGLANLNLVCYNLRTLAAQSHRSTLPSTASFPVSSTAGDSYNARCPAVVGVTDVPQRYPHFA